ncbi:MAG TPA: YHS domain-containing protein [Thermoanaerobaculia bacterium]|nr:YHS domain-containing protein [Thermoanaerobaculia bacterium]
MRSRVAIAAAFIAGLGVAPAALAQHERHQMSAAPGGAGACADHSRASLEIIDRAQRRIEESRQTNNASRMRAAVDDLQQALGELRTHQSLCVSAAATEAKPTRGPMSGSSPGMETMDHSKMSMPGMAPPPKSSPPPGKTKEMDHSQMDMSGKDHSKMSMPGMNAPAKKAQPASASSEGKEMSQGSPQAKTKDPICFKDVDTKGAEKATYQGKTYYFCSRADREKFLSDPAPYVNR